MASVLDRLAERNARISDAAGLPRRKGDLTAAERKKIAEAKKKAKAARKGIKKRRTKIKVGARRALGTVAKKFQSTKLGKALKKKLKRKR